MFLAAPALADEKSAVKEIPAKELKIAFNNDSKVTDPTEIKSVDDLAKSPALEGAADEVKKAVDFEKQKLVLFMWSGSGGDRLAANLKTSTATFTLTRGKTFDLRQHTHLFVVPKDAEVKVAPTK